MNKKKRILFRDLEIYEKFYYDIYDEIYVKTDDNYIRGNAVSITDGISESISDDTYVYPVRVSYDVYFFYE